MVRRPLSALKSPWRVTLGRTGSTWSLEKTVKWATIGTAYRKTRNQTNNSVGSRRLKLMSTFFVVFLLAFGGSSGTSASRATLLIPMRDGVSLATNIFRPENSGGRSPVLLLRTAYNKDSFDAQAKKLAAAGYITLVQDCRGRFASGGTFGLYFNEGQD